MGISYSLVDLVWEPAVIKVNAINIAIEASSLSIYLDGTTKNPNSKSVQRRKIFK